MSVAAPPPGIGEPASAADIPRATYRLQLHAGMDFDAAAEVVPYLAALGVSHAYCSPVLQARPGSTHGYDITDHGALNVELGGVEGFARFAKVLQRHRMSQLLDMVPNHMGVMGADNAWWLDVLENGPASRYADYFDIDWAPLKDELRGKVLVPVLGDHYGNVLDAGELVLELDTQSGVISVSYHEHRFPLDPRTYPLVLARDLDQLDARLDAQHAALIEFHSLLTAFNNLPARHALHEQAIAERARDKTIHQARLAALLAGDAELRAHAQYCLRQFNGDAQRHCDRTSLHELLEAQAYRLAYWRVASDEVNYRRFFDINDLAALRMERDEVFDATHRLVFELIERGVVSGLRIDHPDGLFDPGAYFRRVQARVRELASARDGAPVNSPDTDPAPLYLVAEKILARGESLRADWPVHGTTGYDFSAIAGGVFVDPRGAKALAQVWARFTGHAPALEEIEYRCKHLVMDHALSAELNVLSRELSRIADADPHTRDFTEPTLRRALAEVVACFPVYRTYVRESGACAADEAWVQRAMNLARRRARSIESTVFDFVHEALLARVPGRGSERERAQVLRFAMRVQQLTAPVTAKGVEDTAFYRHHRLASLNEVGDDPARFGVSVADVHAALAERARHWPHAMLGTCTHDSKRSEDVRMRLHVLSEIPRAWAQRVRRWAELNAHHRVAGERDAPDAEDEYSIYQALLGIWPLRGSSAEVAPALRDRLRGHVVKAAREATRHTDWTSPDDTYEQALQRFVDALLDVEGNAPFLDDFVEFHQRVARAGMYNSLALTLIKLTAPGVPDIYQGNELWRFDLVDPDNRRVVDYARRRELLSQLDAGLAARGASALAAELLDGARDGRIKLYVIWRVLTLRRALPGLFRDGAYEPLEVRGERAAHVLAFARRDRGRLAISVLPRLLGGLLADAHAAPVGAEVWGDTRVRLPQSSAGSLHDVFTGHVHGGATGKGELALAAMLERFPLALLVSGDGVTP